MSFKLPELLWCPKDHIGWWVSTHQISMSSSAVSISLQIGSDHETNSGWWNVSRTEAGRFGPRPLGTNPPLSLFPPAVLTEDARCFRGQSYRMEEGHWSICVWAKNNPFQIIQVGMCFEREFLLLVLWELQKQAMLSVLPQLVGVNPYLVWLGPTLVREQGLPFKLSCIRCLRWNGGYHLFRKLINILDNGHWSVHTWYQCFISPGPQVERSFFPWYLTASTLSSLVSVSPLLSHPSFFISQSLEV